eukprot:TRINITY_DN2797_c0_g1::TRINITY_DN2797_c0_g1_i2::g.27672::m.27672 TRINITY_DN2797_c0_g1::TRINITY_DN2797_c0_g1_i2::g.27672  ORF type:complete len:422 (+),score=143.17,sp/Q503L9/NXN_DANRE/39.18/1e-95,sp/Q503L9/NXN_DANRE/43.04/3e-40,Thioredoxin_8/PF13905.1/6.3e-31,Thioredoxin_8/PF13905.1/2.5e-31,Thioredoxin_8/PF13905.1/3.2e+03,AhpC-TSA/PF00578.16/1.3e-09,AhpC-TSA/PF00578.16/3.7e-13,Thioredoxin_2/PF13098.1/2e-09,Thioredoxin_2/PF13098.1/1.4e-12,Thioredoxin/PF00085.15/8.8e-06,Thioredoxin/PF00085.15/0.33,
MVFSALLGNKLQNKDGEVNVADVLRGQEVVGLYFSAHWCPPCRGFTPKLAEIYEGLKKAGKKIEIVFVSSDRDDKAFSEYFAEMPWLALPFADRDAKAKLSRKFKVEGIPTLVLLDSQGGVLTTDGRSTIMEDPEGKQFPWIPKKLSDLLSGNVKRNDGEEVSIDSLKGKYLGVYFSAHWCPPCRKFTPELIKTYNKLKEAGKNFEIIFASSDKDEASFNEYFGEMPWLAFPQGDERIKALSKHFGVQGIPTFVILDEDRKVVTTEAREALGSDPEGAEFPWHPKALNDLANGGSSLNEATCVILVMDGLQDNEDEQKRIIAQLQPVADEYFKKQNESEDQDQSFAFFYAINEDRIIDQVRELCKLGHPKPKPILLILDIPDNGGYYVAGEDVELTTAGIREYLSKFEAKGLQRKQLGQDE